PIANVRAYILDSSLGPLPIGVCGQLYLGGAGLARGYLNGPELTREAFVSSPFDARLLYVTGDRARYLADGTIELLGRVDDQVKIRGHRIELGEIEAVLQAHDAVEDAAVLFHDVALAEPRLGAYIVPRSTVEARDAKGYAADLQRELVS